jgi:alanine-glyoxylate transaminase / serine-glyoxylate transaminase / serine-pyruvate transaminase
MVPEGINGATVISLAFKNYDLALGAGLGQMSGKLFRIGHLGDVNELMILGALAGTEMAMRDAGITQVVPGSGVAAAEELWRRGGVTASAATAAKGEKKRAPAAAAR